jgi:hypothetical protein
LKTNDAQKYGWLTSVVGHVLEPGMGTAREFWRS